jgi:ATP-binding cassette, subfamily B, bacterial
MSVTADSPTLRQRLRIFLRLLRLFWSAQPALFALVFLLNAVTGLFALVDLQLLRRLIDAAQGTVQGRGTLLAPLLWAAALGLFALTREVLTGGTMNVSVKWLLAGAYWEQLRMAALERLFVQTQQMPLERLEQAEHHDQVERATRGLNRANTTMGLLWMAVTNAFAFGALLVYLTTIHWALPLILLIGTTPGLIAGLRMAQRRYLLERKLTPDERRLNAYRGLLTGKGAAAEVRLFGFGGWMIERTLGLWVALRRQRLRYDANDARLNTIFGLFVRLTYVAALAFSVGLFAGGQVGIAVAATLFYAIERFQGNYQMLSYNSLTIVSDLRYLQDLFAFLDGPRLDLDAGRHLDGPIRSGITFRDVGFAYPGSATPALSRLSFTLHPGERLALVGPNGAGKSTLVKLLLGLYQPTSGAITVDGVDLRELAPSHWYRRCGAVFQDFARYQTSPRDNIATGWLEGADRTAVAEAAERSGAADVANVLPDGLDTLLGKEFHQGTDLSVGQWQKLAIARAYLRPAEVLVLDEPASALDAKAEAAVYAQFARMAEGRAVLLISHRLGSCRLADRILVLEGGCLVEEGSHAALLTAGGVYANLYQLQAEWYR